MLTSATATLTQDAGLDRHEHQRQAERLSGEVGGRVNEPAGAPVPSPPPPPLGAAAADPPAQPMSASPGSSSPSPTARITDRFDNFAGEDKLRAATDRSTQIDPRRLPVAAHER